MGTLNDIVQVTITSAGRDAAAHPGHGRGGNEYSMVRVSAHTRNRHN